MRGRGNGGYRCTSCERSVAHAVRLSQSNDTVAKLGSVSTLVILLNAAQRQCKHRKDYSMLLLHTQAHVPTYMGYSRRGGRDEGGRVSPQR